MGRDPAAFQITPLLTKQKWFDTSLCPSTNLPQVTPSAFTPTEKAEKDLIIFY